MEETCRCKNAQFCEWSLCVTSRSLLNCGNALHKVLLSAPVVQCLAHGFVARVRRTVTDSNRVLPTVVCLFCLQKQKLNRGIKAQEASINNVFRELFREESPRMAVRFVGVSFCVMFAACHGVGLKRKVWKYKDYRTKILDQWFQRTRSLMITPFTTL